MAKHIVKQAFWHKGWVQLLSVVSTEVGTYGIWSPHFANDEQQKPMHIYARTYQEEHDKYVDQIALQMDTEYIEELRKEGKLVDDRIAESKKIIQTL
ncbi:hypothetical protein [Flavitalea sp.]|nr:hypothetical protein [Flavitalea sp.]